MLEIESPAPVVILAGRDNSILRTAVLLGASLAGTVALGGANGIFVAANFVARRLLDSIEISVVAGVTSDHGEAAVPGEGLEVSSGTKTLLSDWPEKWDTARIAS